MQQASSHVKCKFQRFLVFFFLDPASHSQTGLVPTTFNINQIFSGELKIEDLDSREDENAENEAETAAKKEEMVDEMDEDVLLVNHS